MSATGEVAKPAPRAVLDGGGCWARCVPRRGVYRGREIQCGNAPRIDALTCHRHKHLEKRARRLEAQLEREGA